MDKEKAEKILELVRKSYDRIAVEFDSTRQKEIWPEIRNEIDSVKKGDKILDLGCGNGRLAGVLPAEAGYLGIDNSEELVRLAKKNFPGRNFMLGDILDFHTDKKFDHIFCLAALQHIPSKRLRISALERMKSALSGNGDVVISNWNMWSRAWKKKGFRTMIIRSYLKNLMRRDGFDFGDITFPWKSSGGKAVSDRYYHAFTGAELKSLSRQAGLKIKKFRKDPYNYWLILN